VPCGRGQKLPCLRNDLSLRVVQSRDALAKHFPREMEQKGVIVDEPHTLTMQAPRLRAPVPRKGRGELPREGKSAVILSLRSCCDGSQLCVCEGVVLQYFRTPYICVVVV